MKGRAIIAFWKIEWTVIMSDEVEKEIKETIKTARLDMSPQLFISLCATKVRSEMKTPQ